jgi:hypothetical protein
VLEVNYLAQLSRSIGFDVINLLNGLRPFAQTELLYFRDDDHLNPRGHGVVARILAEHLRILDSIPRR